MAHEVDCMHAERCPICYGKGVVYGVAETGAYPTTTCYGCQGKGWVSVEDAPTMYPPSELGASGANQCV